MTPEEQNPPTQERALPVIELPQSVLHVLRSKKGEEDMLQLDDLMKGINQLLKNGLDPNSTKSSGKTCLHHIAVKWKKEKNGGILDSWIENLLQSLIQAGADVNKRDEQGKASLHYAAMKGNVEMVRTLLSAGAEPDLADKRNNTPLLLALENSNKTSNAMILYIVQQLIDAGANVNLANPSHGTTALHYACDLGDSKIVNLLLSRGASLTATDKNGFNALLHAVRSKNIKVAQILIDEGSDVNFIGNIGRGKSATPMTALHFAIRNDSMGMLKYLLDRGADPNRLNSFGKSILAFVLSEMRAGDTRLHAMELLLSRKADVRAGNSSGAKSLFELFVSNGRAAEFRLILEHGLDIGRFSPRAPKDFSPLHKSVRCYKNRMLSLLLEYDKKSSLNLDHVDASGETPLSLAVEKGAPDSVRLLVEWGANVDHVNSRGRTPLELAAALDRHTSSDLSCIRILVEAGAKLGNVLSDLVPDPPADVGAQFEALDLGQRKKQTNRFEKAECIVKYRTLYESTKEIADPSEHVGDHMPIQLQQYYNSCKAEIDLLKDTRLYNSVTYHDVLKDKKFYMRVRDDRMYKIFDKEDPRHSGFTLYGQDLYSHFKDMKEMHEIWENAVKKLSHHLRLHHETYYLIIQNVLRRLHNDDLRSVAKSR